MQKNMNPKAKIFFQVNNVNPPNFLDSASDDSLEAASLETSRNPMLS